MGLKIGMLIDFPLNSECFRYLKEKLFWQRILVFRSQHITFLSFFYEPIILAAKLTTSPSTENSLRAPAVPTTPLKHSPEDMPMLHQVLILLSYSMILNPVRIARAASSS